MKAFFQKFFMIIGVMAILGIVGFFVVTKLILPDRDSAQDGQTDITRETLGTTELTITKKTIRESTDQSEIAISYPHFDNPSLDAIIEPYVRQVKGGFSSWVDELSESNFGIQSSLDISYSTRKTTDSLSVIFTGSEYTGGAHPIPFVKTFVIQNDTVLMLDQLFSVPADEYLPQIQTITTKVLSDRFGKSTLFLDGLKPVLENYQHWYLLENGIVFIFAPYQVGPYVIGMPEVTIPFSQIGDLLAR